MVSMPALDALYAREYVFFIGNPVGTVALWKRYQDTDEPVPDVYTAEYPIYQNTRGRGIWNTQDPETTTQDTVEPSTAFWNALDEIQDLDAGTRLDVEDCEWYERELISSLLQMLNEEATIYEMGELLDHASTKAESAESDSP